MKRNLEKDAGLYWNLSRHDERVQDQSHWAGSARWPRKRWLEYGEFNFGLVENFFRQFAPPERPGASLRRQPWTGDAAAGPT